MQKRSGHGHMNDLDAALGSPETIGVYIRKTRLHRDISLEEVSEATGVTTAVLQALENEEREKLPAEVYIKAFYKKYAEYLGLDPDDILARYQQQSESLKKAGQRHNFSTVVTIKGQAENNFMETLRRLFLPIAILVLGLLLFWIYTNYLAPYNPLGFYQERPPTGCSFLLPVPPLFC